MRAAQALLHREPRLLPESRAGRWALGLFACSVAGFGFLVVVAATGHRGGEMFRDSWLLAAPALLAGSACAAAAAVGTYAILRRHEHGAFVYVATAIGLVVISFVVSEAFATR